MNDLLLPELERSHKAVEIPDMLRPLSAVVMARLSHTGVLLDFNRGFARLLGEEKVQVGNIMTSFFINPSIGELIDQGRGGRDGVVFEGILTLGDPQTQCQSLRGAIWWDARGFLLVAEYDVAHMEILASSVLELNNALSELQRKLTRQNVELKRSHDRIHALSLTDTLTEVGNRRAFNERLRTELDRSDRTGVSFGLILVDIDHFKSVNDCFGHDVGDLVLKASVQSLRQAIRPYDFLSRIGGEEFMVILPETDLATTLDVAERLRGQLAGEVVAAIGRPVTASFGATLWQSGDTPESLFQRVDQAVYAAKDAGRNCVRQGKP